MDEITRDIEQIQQQEQQLVFDRFDADSAWVLGGLIRELAVQGRLPIAIDIRRFNQPLFYCAMPGTTPDNPDWVRRKSNTVARFYRSSYAVGLHLQRQQANLTDKYGLPHNDFSAHGGSFPLTVAGAGVIGSITVSGLPQRQDHGLVIEALCRMLERDYEALTLA